MYMQRVSTLDTMYCYDVCFHRLLFPLSDPWGDKARLSLALFQQRLICMGVA